MKRVLSILAIALLAHGVYGQDWHVLGGLWSQATSIARDTTLPVLWWSFNSTNDDGSVYDDSGNGWSGYNKLDGDVTPGAGTTITTNGLFNLSFDGANIASIGTTNSGCTLLSESTTYSIVMKIVGPASTGFRARNANHGMAVHPIRMYHNGVEAATANRVTVNPTTWTTVALIYNNGTLTSYSNLTATVDTSGFSGSNQWVSGWYIVRSSAGSCFLDYVRLYDYALTFAQYTNIYYTGY